MRVEFCKYFRLFSSGVVFTDSFPCFEFPKELDIQGIEEHSEPNTDQGIG